MPSSSSLPPLGLSQIRSFWLERQGLASPLEAPPAELVARTGWARTLGGIDVYLALRARNPSIARANLEGELQSGALRVVPAVRGCIYLVPAAEVPLLMTLAADLSRPRTQRELLKAGVDGQEVEDLAAAVLEVLAQGPLGTREIRKALPADSVRSLGEAGKKVGLSSPLPVALRELEFRGAIERTPVGHRLDTEVYQWHRSPVPDAVPTIPELPEERLALVVRRVLEFFAPLSIPELATWIGIPQRDIKAALETLEVRLVAIEGCKAPAVVLEELWSSLEQVEQAPAQFRFLPFGDNLLTVHGGPAIFTDPKFHDLPVERWGGAKARPLGQVNHLGRRPLFLGERLVGFWEFDPEAEEVVVGLLEALSAQEAEDLNDARVRLAEFLQQDLGHARSFSLDTEAALLRRATTLRSMDTPN